MNNNAELRISFIDLMNIANGVPGFTPGDAFNHLMVLIIRYLYTLNASLQQIPANHLLHDRIVRNAAMFNIFLNENERIIRAMANPPLAAWNRITDDFNLGQRTVGAFVLNRHVVNTYFTNANPMVHELEGSRSILFLLRIFLINASACLVAVYSQNVQHPLLAKINRIIAYVDAFIQRLGHQIGPLQPVIPVVVQPPILPPPPPPQP